MHAHCKYLIYVLGVHVYQSRFACTCLVRTHTAHDLCSYLKHMVGAQLHYIWLASKLLHLVGGHNEGNQFVHKFVARGWCARTTYIVGKHNQRTQRSQQYCIQCAQSTCMTWFIQRKPLLPQHICSRIMFCRNWASDAFVATFWW